MEINNIILFSDGINYYYFIYTNIEKYFYHKKHKNYHITFSSLLYYNCYYFYIFIY